MKKEYFDYLLYAADMSYVLSFFYSLFVKVIGLNFLIALRFYLGICLLCEIALKINKWTYFKIYHIFDFYTLTASLSLGLFFFWILPKLKISIVSAVSIIIGLTVIQVVKNDYALANISYLLLSVLVISLVLHYFYRLFQEPAERKVTDIPLFWINSAFFMYFGTTIFLTLFENYLLNDDTNLYFILWPIQNISTIIFNVVILVGLWKLKRESVP